MATEVKQKPASHGSSRTNELVAIVLVVVALLVFLSLVSYSPNDWTLNTASSQKTQNWVGVLGSLIADGLFQFVGSTAYFLPFLMWLIAWRIFRSVGMRAPIGRVAGFTLLILSISGLLPMLFSSINPGGIVGLVVSAGLIYTVGTIGATILLFTFLFVSILLISDFTFLMVYDSLHATFGNLPFEGWVHRFREWRQEQDLLAKERLEKRRLEQLDEAKATKQTDVAKPIKTTILAEQKAKPVEPKPIEKIEDPIVEPEPQIKRSEELRPKIIFNEDPSPIAITEDLPPFDMGNIQITPIKATGELEQLQSGKLTDPEQLKSDEPTEFEMPEDETDVPIPEPAKAASWDDYILPSSEFLAPAPPRIEQKEDEFFAVAKELVEKTGEFNVTGTVKHICQGPVVTTYEFKPDAGVKYSRITGLSDDLCLALKAESIRIDRIPGKAVVGIEVPNQNRETIYLRKVIESDKFKDASSLLTIALGKSIDGLNYVADLTKMPHLLMAGQTGAGKSVGINTLIVSILYKARPDEVKMIMVDPKQVELGIYADIPHLATPIIKDPKRASVALKWAVGQMEKRYKDLAGWGVRNIDGYNAEIKRRNEAEHYDDNGEPWKKLPYLVIIIDELADLMMVAGKEVEESITRLAQMARAVGIHLVLATQRPSVDVITGLIKANFPSRISFRVSSKVDSRTIIDANGAESLLGRGDMLFLPPGTSNLVRVHGAFVDEREITKIVDHIKAQGKPEYDITITKTTEEMDETGELPGRKDPLFIDALRSVVSAKRASTSLLQRHLRIGYGRAAAILDAMVREEFIGEMDGGSRARPILEKAYEFLQGYDSVKDDDDF